MLESFFCPLCHRFFEKENRVFRAYGGPELVEIHEELIRKALELLGLQETDRELEGGFSSGLQAVSCTDEGWSVSLLVKSSDVADEFVYHLCTLPSSGVASWCPVDRECLPGSDIACLSVLFAGLLKFIVMIPLLTSSA